MSMIISGDNGATFPTGRVQPDASNPYVMKNRIINGAMVIDQRNAGASVTIPATGGQYTLDRWAAGASQASKYSVQQSTTAPAGFINSLKVTSASAYSVGSGDLFYILQNIEGLNVADLAWGTANAKTVTLSFQVYSSLTGTFGGAIQNSAVNRSYPFSYTISSANTWTTISVTIAGDTSGTWLTTNGIGISVLFGLGVGTTYSGTAGSWSGSALYSATGATSVVGTNGATFYITGVQLEVGSQATNFEWRPYGMELALCQRYFQLVQAGNGRWTVTNATGCIIIPIYLGSMRTGPTAALQGASVKIENYAGTDASVSSITSIVNARPNGSAYILLVMTGGTGTTTLGYECSLYSTSDTSGIALSAEL